MALSFQNGVAYQEVKPQDADSLPIILVHGAGSSHLGWPSGIRHLPGRHIFAIDLPNHGKSAKKELNSIEEYALDLQVFLDSLGIEKANWSGIQGSAIVCRYVPNPAFCAKSHCWHTHRIRSSRNFTNKRFQDKLIGLTGCRVSPRNFSKPAFQKRKKGRSVNRSFMQTGKR